MDATGPAQMGRTVTAPDFGSRLSVSDYAITLNASTSVKFGPRFGRTAHEEILRLLKMMDGEDHFSIVMWKMPAGKTITEVTTREESQSPYLQGGGSAEAMVLEERSAGGRGAEQWAIGHPPREDETTVAITISGTSAAVVRSEVLVAAEAAEVFMAYFESDAVPANYSRRIIDLPTDER